MEEYKGITTARVSGVATVTIDEVACTGCGLCVTVCRGAPLYLESGKVHVDQARLYGCIGCGQCAAVCPQGCIMVEGRDLHPDDLIPLPPPASGAAYDQLSALLLSRRSVRDFRSRPVAREDIDRVLAAVSTAPMGIPPTDVSVLVFDGFDKVQALAGGLLAFMQRIRWFLSPTACVLMRPFIGKEAVTTFREFLGPAIDVFLEKRAEGVDWLTYGAPLAMYFYTSPFSDPVDPLVAATYAVVAAQSLGLGSCMLGLPAYCFRYSKHLRDQYGIPDKSQHGILVIFGHPAVTYRRAIRRRLAAVTFV